MKIEQIEKMTKRSRLNTIDHLRRLHGKTKVDSVLDIAMVCDPIILAATLMEAKAEFEPFVFKPMMGKYIKCAATDKWVPKDEGKTTADGYFIGNKVFDQYTHICEHCGKAYFKQEFERICEACAETHTFCDECGEITARQSLIEWYGQHLCESCADDVSFRCSHCGNRFSSDESHSYSGDEYCENCYESLGLAGKEYIRDYSFRPRLRDYGTERRFGMELEFEGCHSAAKTLCQHSDDIYCKHDGSIDSGFEVVTKPLLLMDMRKLGAEIGSIAKSEDLSGHNSTCGIHVHVSRAGIADTDVTIGKLLLIFAKFESQIALFARRNSSRWAKVSHKNKEGLKANPKQFCDEERNDRYRAINLCNDKTIEFRIFKGTNRSSTIQAIVMFVNAIIDAAEKVGIDDIDTMSWTDLFKDKIGQSEYDVMFEYMKKKDIEVSGSITSDVPVPATPIPTSVIPEEDE